MNFLTRHYRDFTRLPTAALDVTSLNPTSAHAQASLQDVATLESIPDTFTTSTSTMSDIISKIPVMIFNSKPEVDDGTPTMQPTAFSLVTRVSLAEPETVEVGGSTWWTDPTENALWVADNVAPAVAGVSGLVVVLLVLGVKQLRECKLCWHLLSLVAAVWLKVVVLIPVEAAVSEPGGWRLGGPACHAASLLDYLQTAVIPLTTVWLCVDRLWFCFRPDVYRVRMCGALAGGAVGAVWVCAACTALALTYAWGPPAVTTLLRSDGVNAGGGGAHFAYNHSTCDEAPSGDAGPGSWRGLLVDVGLFAVPSALGTVLWAASLGACCVPRRLFYEDRGPVRHALVFVFVLVLLYSVVTATHFYWRFDPSTPQGIQAEHTLRAQRIILVAQRAFYAVLPVVLLLCVQEVREGIKSIGRGCSQRGDLNERTRLVKPM